MNSKFEIKINKEIRSYTESIFFGLSLRQTIFSIIACGIAVLIYMLLIDKLGTEITSWFCVLAASPFALFGFVKFQGMYLEDVIKTALYSIKLSNTKLYNKPFNLYEELFKGYIKQKEKESIKHAKNTRKIKKIKQRKG